MRVTQHGLRVWAGLIFAGLTLAPMQWALAQDVVPTPEQLEMLRNLSSEQREALKKQVGIESSSASHERGSNEQGNHGAPQILPRSAMTPAQREQIERERLFLQPEDSVIIEIDFHLPALEPSASAPAIPGSNVTPTPGGNAVAAPAPAATPPPSQVEPREELPPEEQEALQKLIDLIRGRNPYRLSRDGVLWLPGIEGIALAGLTAEQATLRLSAERVFRHLDIRLIRLPLDKIGPEALKPFGYDLFDETAETFAPGANVPVPADYIIGSGDQLDIQLYGNDNRSFTLTVDRDGSINFPQLGPIRIAGQRFNSAKESIEARVRRQMIGVQANVSMGDTRSIRVFVAGEAKRPGSYTVSGLGTVTSALYAAGGIKSIGSLRNVELKRQGRLVRRLDLYDLLLRGDTSDDASLLPGDVVFVPPIGATAAVYGEVHRPAIYELLEETSAAQLISLAGGLTAEADTARAVLTQIDSNHRRVIVNVDLAASTQGAPALRNGDLLRIARLRPTLDSGVVVRGHVHTPGAVAFREGLRLSNVIASVDELQPNADIHYVLIRREDPKDRRVSMFSADLARALAAPGSEADIALAARDQITVFDLESGRDRIIQPLLDELRLQASFDRPTEVVRVDGRTKVPGEYPLEPGMTVSDLIRAGGGLNDAAYGGKAELSRYSVVNGESRRTELIVVDLAAVLHGDPAADIPLKPFDSLSVKEVQEWGQQEQITLKGEVRFPGLYSIQRGETMRSVIARAGGLTAYAYPEGSVFTRTELKEREQRQLDVLSERLQNDLGTMALQGAAANQAQAGLALSVGQSLLTQLRSSKAVGRLVIDLPRTLRAHSGSSADLILRGGDSLIVPRLPQEVTVLGEVQTATSHLYRPELARDDYIALSGGATRKADRHNVYVVRADGSVVANGGSRWFRTGAAMKIKPGDTVVVPLDTERLPRLPFWQAVTQILYNLAISAAAVNSF